MGSLSRTQADYKTDYEVIRDRVLAAWKLAKRAETKERIALAIDNFIAELKALEG